jgi:signal transduction histidine kinase
MSLQSIRPVVIASVALALALGVLGWFDYRAVTGELRTVVAAQAEALHGTVAAAARAQHAAAEQAEASLLARLLEAARLLRELDRAGQLSQDVAAVLSVRNTSFRITVFSADGERELEAGDRPGRGAGQRRGLGEGRGQGAGPPAGAARVAQRLIAGEADEIASPPHTARDGHQRVAAGVRRPRGGAIVLTASSEAARELDDVYSLSALLAEIARATPALAYIVIDADGRRVADGPLAAGVSDTDGSLTEGVLYRILPEGRVLEHRRPITLGESGRAWLRVGMRLDEVERGERRTLARIAAGVSAAIGFAVVALAFVTLRRRYGALSEEHARAQDALRRRDRLAAMGELASTVAHEIRNPLNAIAMSAQRLTREYPMPAGAADREELEDLLGVIQRESTRINGTIEQFLDYARPRPLDRRTMSLSPFLGELASAAASVAAARGVSVVSRCDHTLAGSIDPAQMAQALDNLLRNAIEASRPGGTVTLEGRPDGRGLAITVRDEGAGIPATVLPRIFDLYFTTRPEGTGVGLAVAQQIVSAHGGTIEVESVEGRGTTMRVRLPAVEVDGG